MVPFDPSELIFDTTPLLKQAEKIRNNLAHAQDIKEAFYNAKTKRITLRLSCFLFVPMIVAEKENRVYH